MSRQLTQEEINTFFEGFRKGGAELRESSKGVQPFDFRRPDRISKTQVRALHMLHDSFVRNLMSSLSAYLRAYLTAQLVSVEQLSYVEFLEGLSSPSCLVSLGMKPYEGSALLELGPSLVFPTVEALLGGTGKAAEIPQRQITEIEKSLLGGFFRIITQDLRSAWKGVAQIEFNIEAIETEAQFLRILAPQEAVVAVHIEVHIGEHVGMMNLAIPSMVIKMMRHKFDHHWSNRKLEAPPSRQQQILSVVKEGEVELNARLTGPVLPMGDLLRLAAGDVVMLDYPLERGVTLDVNGVQKYTGRLVVQHGRKAFEIVQVGAPRL